MTVEETTAENLIERFEDGRDVTDYFDMEHPMRVNRPERRRISIDMPVPQITRLDAMASRIGITRQALINIACDKLLNEEDDRLRRSA